MNLSIQNLSKNYNDQVVFSNLNLEIKSAKSIGIIGESGCGKSTLLRLIAGIEDYEGEVCLDGMSSKNDKKKLQQKLGFVFQKHSLFPHLSIKQNIMLILTKIKKLSKQEAEIITENVLSQLRITAEKDKKPNEVSGGQAQRASIARAIATKPNYIFLDEPTAALDPILTNEVLNSVIELKNTGIEFVFVTHEMSFLKSFCDYVIFIKDGQICEHGGLECLTEPKTQELAEFLRHEV